MALMSLACAEVDGPDMTFGASEFLFLNVGAFEVFLSPLSHTHLVASSGDWHGSQGCAVWL